MSASLATPLPGKNAALFLSFLMGLQRNQVKGHKTHFSSREALNTVFYQVHRTRYNGFSGFGCGSKTHAWLCIFAIKEARKLNIPIVGLVDTNCDPNDVDYVIPGNDDAIRAVKLITDVMANAIIEGKQGESLDMGETTSEQNVESDEAESMDEVASNETEE